jgi:hypothetical protein
VGPSRVSISWSPKHTGPSMAESRFRPPLRIIPPHDHIIADFRRDVMRFIASRHRRRPPIAARWARRWR